MRCPRRKTRLHKKLISVLCVIIVLSIGLFCLFEYKARDLVHNLVDNELEIHAMNAIDRAVSDALSQAHVEYDSLITMNCSSNGEVTSLQTNTSAVNMLKSTLSLGITENIRHDSSTSVGVPAGAFTGIILFSDFGPDIKVKLTLGGSASTTIKSEFISAGINQTVHRIYLIVDANVSLTCPIIFYETDIITEYELCQTVIVGATPQFFADVGE